MFPSRSGHLNASLPKPINLRYANVNFSVTPSLNSGTKHLTLLIIVKSARNNFWKRNIVRQTWGKPKFLDRNTLLPHNVSTRVFFICGKSDNLTKAEKEIDSSLAAESGLHEDLIIANFHDSYRNNTYKSLVAFKWALNGLGGDFKYLALFDDDIYVDIFNLGAFFKNLRHKRVSKHKSVSGYPYYQITRSQDNETTGVADITSGLYIGYARTSDWTIRRRSMKQLLNTGNINITFELLIISSLFVFSFKMVHHLRRIQLQYVSALQSWSWNSFRLQNSL